MEQIVVHEVRRKTSAEVPGFFDREVDLHCSTSVAILVSNECNYLGPPASCPFHKSENVAFLVL